MKLQKMKQVAYYISLALVALGIIGTTWSIFFPNYWRDRQVNASARTQQIVPRTLILVEKAENESGEKIFHRITKAVRSDGAEYEGRAVMDGSEEKALDVQKTLIFPSDRIKVNISELAQSKSTTRGSSEEYAAGFWGTKIDPQADCLKTMLGDN